MVKAVAKRANVYDYGKVTPHTFRRTFATNLYNQGEEVIQIRDLMGHESIHSTQRYIITKKEDLVNIKNPLEDFYGGSKSK